MKKAFASAFLLLAIMSLSAQDKKPLRTHYFYNSGWLVETPKHVLVFDFVPHPASGITTATLAGEVERAAAGGKRVVQFITHDHPDHYTDSVFTLENKLPGITYVMGWKPKALPAVQSMRLVLPGDSLVSNSLDVYAHAATDEGSGFLVQVDGYSIYHAGDHALWVEELLPVFTKELEYIRTKAPSIDLAFLPAAKGLAVQCATDSVLIKGVRISALLLQPKTIALQHIGCADKLGSYAQIRNTLSAIHTRWIIPARFNQSF